MRKILLISLIFFGFFLITGCSNEQYITDVNYSQFKELLKNKETFAIEIYQTGCSHCESLKPKLERVLKEYNIKIYGLNMADMSDEDYKAFKKEFGDLGTPTIIFVEDGHERGLLYRLVGDQTERQIIKKFKNNGYIKEEE